MVSFDPIAALQAQLSSVASFVSSSVENSLGSAEKGFFDNVFTPVINVLDAGLNDIEGGFSSLGTSIANDVSTAVQDVGSGLTSLGNDVISSINKTVSVVSTGFANLSQQVVTGVSSAFVGVEQIFTDLKNAVFQGLGTVAQDVGSAFQAISNEVTNTFVPILNTIGQFIEGLPQDFATIAKDIVAGVEKIPAALEALGEKVLNSRAIQTILTDAAALPVELADLARSAINVVLMPALKELFAVAGFDASTLTGPAVDRIIEVAVAQQLIQEAEEALGAQGFIIANLIDRVSDPLLRGSFRELEYAGNVSNPNSLLDMSTNLILFHRKVISEEDLKAELLKEGYSEDASTEIILASYNLNGIGELVQAYFRGQIASIGDFTDRAKKLGYAAQDIAEIVEVSRPLIDPLDAIRMWRRGIVPDGDKDAFEDLRRRGYTDTRIDAMKAASYELPNIFNIQDFAVRQVNNPAIVEKFKLDYLRDETYMTGAKKLGYSEEDATQIYRYYWEYPPFFQMARLFTNGHLPEADFRDILGFLRFTPYWQDRLVADLKPALTEAEVKDRYKYQLISADELVTELMKVGKTAEIAQQIAELWIVSVTLANPNDHTAAQIKAAKAQGLTVSLILEGYKDGVETVDSATSLMSEIGIGSDEATLHIKIADYSIHKAMVTDEVAAIKAEVGGGTLSINDAIIQLQNLGITASQLDRYSAELTKLTTHKPKIPTLAELTAWTKKGIIQLSDFVIGLRILGYADGWIPYYLAAAGADYTQIAELGFSGPTVLSSPVYGNTQSNDNPSSGTAFLAGAGGDASSGSETTVGQG